MNYEVIDGEDPLFSNKGQIINITENLINVG